MKKPTTQKPFGQLALVGVRAFELSRVLGEGGVIRWDAGPEAYRYVALMRGQEHLVVRQFKRSLKAGGASLHMLVVVVRRQDGVA